MAKARILLVEDNQLQGSTTRQFLEKMGYEVIWVEDGKSSIKSAKTDNPDLIILDLMLPDINGNEVCRWLKLNEDTKSIPILMLTSVNTIQNKIQGLEAGAEDYLPKPYNEMELNARIYTSLRTKSLQDELRKKNNQLEDLLHTLDRLASTDSLTGLYNRRRFESVLEKEYKRMKRYGTTFSCLIVDIDYFKKVNDAHGHKAGDAVLREIADILKSNVRQIDTIARWGGEEFVILMPETRKEEASIAAKRILQSVEEHKFPAAPDISLTVSIGLAQASDYSQDDSERVLHAADMAMYEAKRKGRNRLETA